MNLQIINGCAGTDPRLQIAGTNPGRHYHEYVKAILNRFYFPTTSLGDVKKIYLGYLKK